VAGDAEGAAREMEAHLGALEQGLDLSPPPRGGTSLRAVLQAAIMPAEG
jgi:hypothetical protein